MPQIPQAGFNTNIGMNVPTQRGGSDRSGDIALGNAIQKIGSQAASVITDYDTMEAKAIASTHVIKSTEADKQELLQFSEKAKLMMDEEGKIKSKVMDANGALVSSELPILGTLGEDISYVDATKKAQDILMSRGQQAAPNRYAYEGYTAEMAPVFESNLLNANGTQIKHISIQTTKAIDDLGTKIVGLSGEYAKNANLNGQPTMKLVEKDVLNYLTKVDRATYTSFSLNEAQAKKERVVRESFAGYLSNVQSFLKDKTKPTQEKKELLATLQYYVNPNNVTYLSGFLSGSDYRNAQNIISQYGLSTKNQVAKMGAEQLSEYEATLIRNGNADDSMAVKALSDLSEGVDPYTHAQAVSRVMIAKKAMSVINSFQEQPPSEWDNSIKKAIETPLDKEFIDTLPNEIKKSVNSENINGIYKQKLDQLYKQRKAKVLEERKDDPAWAAVTQIKEGKDAYNKFLQAKGDLAQGHALKELSTTLANIQTTKMYIPVNDQRTFPKDLTKSIAAELESAGEDYSLSNSTEKFKNVLDSMGPDIFQKFLKEAKGDKINIPAPYQAAAYMGDDDTVGLFVELGATAPEISAAYEKIGSKVSNEQIKSSIRAKLIPFMAKMNSNIAGFSDVEFQNSLIETGALYTMAVQSSIVKPSTSTSGFFGGKSVNTTMDDYVNILKRNFKEITYGNDTIVVPANRNHKAIETFIKSNGGAKGLIEKAIESDNIQYPSEFKTDAEKENFREMIKDLARIKNTGHSLRLEYVQGNTRANPDVQILRKVLMDKNGKPYEIDLEEIEKKPDATPKDNRTNRAIEDGKEEEIIQKKVSAKPIKEAITEIAKPVSNLKNDIVQSEIGSSALNEAIKREMTRMSSIKKTSGRPDLTDPYAMVE